MESCDIGAIITNKAVSVKDGGGKGKTEVRSQESEVRRKNGKRGKKAEGAYHSDS
jgi:hypothetical protein